MREVNVSHFERGALTVQTAGAEGRQTALMRQLRERVRLIHELRQLRGTEKFLDCGGHRADIDEVRRHGDVHILKAHALAHDALEACEAHADLVLEQLADRTDAAVAKVVDVVRMAETVGHTEHVRNGSHHIVRNDMPRDQVIIVLVQERLLLLVVHALHLGKERKQRRDVDVLVEPCIGRCKGQEGGSVCKVVANDLHALLAHAHPNGVHACVLDGLRGLAADGLALLREDLARDRGNDRRIRDLARDAIFERELFVELIAADARKIVALVEEQRVHEGARALLRGRLAGALALVDLDEALRDGAGRVLLQRSHEALVLAEQLDDLGVRAITNRAQQRGDVHLALAVDLDVEDTVRVGLVFEPGAAVGDDLRLEQPFADLVEALGIVHAGRTHELRHDNALRAVDDERTGRRHEREIAHKDLLLLDLARFLIDQANARAQGRRIVHVAFLALLHGVFRIVKVDFVIDELQHELSGIVRNGRDVVEYVAKVFL